MNQKQWSDINKLITLKPVLVVSFAVLAYTASMAYATTLLLHANWFWYSLSQIIFAVVYFRSFALMHECVHNSAAQQRWVNVVLGHIASVGCGLPFYPWRYIHLQHHTWAGNPEMDPTASAVLKWRNHGVPTIVKWTWRFWIPLAAVIQHWVFWVYPLTIKSGLKQFRAAVSVTFLIAVYGTAIAWWGKELLWFIPSVILYLVLTELVNLPHHLGMPTVNRKLPAWLQWQVTRSCLYPKWICDEITLNFNFHTEHHLFPHLPWWRLPEAREVIKNFLSEDYTQEIGIGWNLKNRSQDPEKLIRTDLGPLPKGITPANGQAALAWDLLWNSLYVKEWVPVDSLNIVRNQYILTWNDPQPAVGRSIFTNGPAGPMGVVSSSLLYPDTWMHHHLGCLSAPKDAPKTVMRKDVAELMATTIEATQKATNYEHWVIYVERSKPFNMRIYQDFSLTQSTGNGKLALRNVEVYRGSSKIQFNASYQGFTVDKARWNEIKNVEEVLFWDERPVEYDALNYRDMELKNFEERCHGFNYERTRSIFVVRDSLGFAVAALIAETGSEGANIFGLMNSCRIISLEHNQVSSHAQSLLLRQAAQFYRERGKIHFLVLDYDQQKFPDELVHVSGGLRWIAHKDLVQPFVEYLRKLGRTPR